MNRSETAKFLITMLTERFSSWNLNRPQSTIELPMQVRMAIASAANRWIGFLSKSMFDDSPVKDSWLKLFKLKVSNDAPSVLGRQVLTTKLLSVKQ